VLTLVDGRVVHGDREFKDLAPSLPPVMPEWSPVRSYGGYQQSAAAMTNTSCAMHRHAHAAATRVPIQSKDARGFWGALGCGCFAF